jgi:hypothetical protein
VRVFLVVGEGAADREAEAAVQGLRRAEGGVRARLEAEALVAALARGVDDAPEHGAAGAAAAQGSGRAHRLDLAVGGCQLLERAATEQGVAVPHGPEGDLGDAQLGEVQREHVLGRRELVHVGEVLAQQVVHGGAGEVVEFDVHGARPSRLLCRS